MNQNKEINMSEALFENETMNVAAVATTTTLRAVDQLTFGRVGKAEIDLGEFTMTIVTKKKRAVSRKKTAKKTAKKTVARKKVAKKTATRRRTAKK